MNAATVAAVLVAVVAVTIACRMHGRARRADIEIETLHHELRTARHAASRDPLTDLLNRRAFYHQALSLIGESTLGRRVVVVIDLDHFKQINDSLGHAAGDRVLASIAHRLAEHADGSPAARLGGDEFVALLTIPDGDRRPLHLIARHLADTLSMPIGIGAHTVSVSVSIGLAAVRGPDLTHLAAALQDADHEMYLAKAASRQPVYDRDESSSTQVSRPATDEISRSIPRPHRPSEPAPHRVHARFPTNRRR